MFYKISYSVPPNTSILSPNWQKLQIRKGRIKKFIIYTPLEAADLLRYRVEYHGMQLIPYSGKGWMYGIFSPTTFEVEYQILEPPYVLDIYAYNDDDLYEHEYNIGVIMEEIKTEVKTSIPTPFIQRFRRIMGGA